jgi:hypothetical protein
MFNQHAKWLEKSKKELDWRAPVPSINILDYFSCLAAGSQWFLPTKILGFSMWSPTRVPMWSASICRPTRTACSA